MNTTSAECYIRKLNACFMEIELDGNLTSIIAFWKQSLFGLLGFSPSFGKDSDDKVATKQLTVVVDVRVDVTFMPHDDQEISDSHESRDILIKDSVIEPSSE